MQIKFLTFYFIQILYTKKIFMKDLNVKICHFIFYHDLETIIISSIIHFHIQNTNIKIYTYFILTNLYSIYLYIFLNDHMKEMLDN